MSEPTKACLDMAPRVAEIMGLSPKPGIGWVREREHITPTLEQCLDFIESVVDDYVIYSGEPKEIFTTYQGRDSDYRGETLLEMAYRAVIAVGEGE